MRQPAQVSQQTCTVVASWTRRCCCCMRLTSVTRWCRSWAVISCDRVCRRNISTQFLSAFAKLRKAVISFATGRILIKLDVWAFLFWKSVEKIQVSLKPDRNNGYFTWRRFHIYDSISFLLLRMRNVIDKICIENQNTHFMFNIVFPKIVPFMR